MYIMDICTHNDTYVPHGYTYIYTPLTYNILTCTSWAYMYMLAHHSHVHVHVTH